MNPVNKIDKKIRFAFKWNAEKAFRLLYDEFYDFLIARGISIIPDQQVIEDLIQDLFVTIYKEKKYKYINNFESYLWLSLKNKCFNYIKNVKIQDDYKSQYIHDTDFEDPRIEKIKENLHILPERCREIFEKIVFEEHSYESVALDRNISINTVKTQMKRAYSIIREKTNAVG